jgi:UDP-N-acetylglucosamine diphosphorylase/glucosamine-1-phosphate N-acetyltransferase
MKAIILASWEWSRLRPLTDTTPKPLLKILGKTLIEYNLDILNGFVDECIIVVKYKSNLFPQEIWDTYMDMKISYHEQWDKVGTAAAIEDIKVSSDEKLLILYGDSIYPKADLKKVLMSHDYGCLVKEVENPEIYGIFEEKNNTAIRVIEKPQEYIWNLANMWGFCLSGEIIDMCKQVKKSERWEYEITDAINAFILKHPFKLHRLSEDILDIWYAWNLLDANQKYLWELRESTIQWTIEDNVTIKGNIILETGAIIKSGTYIEWNCYFGRDTVIWPNAYVRGNTSLWERWKIWFSVEVKNSYIWENSKLSHLSYLWDSVVGNNVNLGCGFKTANLRHDGKNMRVMLKWDLIDTNRQKFGCIIWDNTKTAINTQVYSGRILETGSSTIPGEIVK